MRKLLAITLTAFVAVACTDTLGTSPDPIDSSQIASARADEGYGPSGSQRLRGLGGRVFAVHVEEVSPPGPGFDNCYYFLEDGTWVDPLFFGGVPGTWTQHRRGAATPYTANAEFQIPDGPLITLVQEGKVTPARGRGVLQLTAHSTVFVDGAPVATFFSRGQEVDECPFTF